MTAKPRASTDFAVMGKFAGLGSRYIGSMSTSPAPTEIAPKSQFSQLPPYTRSLLKVSLPVRVQLTEKKESVGDVIAIGPGTILSFTKKCDEPLELFVDNQLIAVGEAVKLGEKFGFRIHEMTLPSEHFYLVQRRKAAEEAQAATDDEAEESSEGEDASDAEE
ncbi:FliM/FliN family flagellar motor C-terminal domain-containing protein [Adhaeretor mobilis]|uniref:Flagellar motor switch protein FliN n=1 Tax=Adhaeretor mobilis TaxID=1930276 RepID=A0A517MQH4_9BACT|nr:FliM/FliN family flagellar motor C-terminal domain-containing protein [Adhaeretor mobilis]QDS97140.1 Flagellar motor switch protein FliN [Adhaeretor mobilis]